MDKDILETQNLSGVLCHTPKEQERGRIESTKQKLINNIVGLQKENIVILDVLWRDR